MTFIRHRRQRSTSMVREGDLVRLIGCVGSYRVRSLDYTTGKAMLAHMSGAPAGEWVLDVLVPLAEARQ